MSRIGDVLHAALRDEWDGLERINRDLRLADLFTLLNAFMGLAALTLAAYGEVRWAVHLVLAGIILDGVDGAVARLGKGNGPLGGTLDSLADGLTFVTTSVVVVFVWLDADSVRDQVLVAVPLGFFAACGLLRLARFESMRDDGKERKYFSGLPTPGAAMTLLALILLGDVPPWLVLALAGYLGVLMVSRVRFPKLRGWSGLLAALILLVVLASFDNRELQQVATIALLSFMGLYVVGGPFFVLTRYGALQGPQAEGR